MSAEGASRPRDKDRDPVLNLVRTVFALACASLGWEFAREMTGEPNWFSFFNVAGMVLGLFLALFLVGSEFRFTEKFFAAGATLVVGLAVGVVIAHLFYQGLLLVPQFKAIPETVHHYLRLGVGLVFSFYCIAFILRTQDRFRVLVPFIDLKAEAPPRKPILLDTSVIIDGRIVDLVHLDYFESVLIVPRFVIDELQALSDSADSIRRHRGRRGLEILSRLQNETGATLEIAEIDVPGDGVDRKLLEASRRLRARVLTNDFNLEKIAQLEQVPVLNINHLAEALKIVVMPGENIDVKLIRAGENEGQAVGYLDDGTMVVVEEGAGRIGTEAQVRVTSVIQTQKGRMVFSKLRDPERAPSR